MKKILIILALCASGMVAKAQFADKDTLIKFVNKWIRNSAVDAFTNLRLNTALIGMINQADSAGIKKVEVSGTTLRIITIGKDTFSVTLPGGGGGNTNSNIGSGFRIAVPNTNNLKTVFAGLNLLLDSSTNTNALTFKMDTSGVSLYYLRRNDSTLYTSVSRLRDTAAAIRASVSLVTDVPTLSQIEIFSAAQGVASSSNVSNYSHTSVDSARYKFSTTRAGTAGTEYGGWLAPSTSGDSIRVTAPFGVVGGDSQAEGHPGRHGQLHPLVSGVPQSIYLPGYPDSTGQLTYHLRSLTHFKWYNSGIGGQTSEDLRARFLRDMLGITSNPSDGRGGSATIPGLPSIVVIVVGINDLFASITAERTIENLEWMASQCQQRGVRCVVLNLPGEAFHTQTSLRQAQKINQYLKNGVLDQYGACVVDYNRWWQNPAYNDDIHPSSLIVDDIHPTTVGYDSLAHVIFREAKLPVLTNAVFINELDPGGFTGYSRPAGITINGAAYTIGSANDTINITTYVPDSVWIKVTSSTNITGTSYTGFSSIIWKLDNNVNDSTWYTRKTLYSGSLKMSQSVADMTIQAVDYTTEPSFLIKYPDGTPYMYTRVKGNGQTVFNGSSAISSATLSVYGSIATNGTVTGAANSSFGGLLIGNTASGGGAGYGVGIVGGALTLDGINGYNNNIAIALKRYFSSTSNLGSDGRASIVNIAGGYDSFTGSNDTAHLLRIDATLNNTNVTQRGNVLSGISYSPIITSQGVTKLDGISNTRGVNRFNMLGERSVVGNDGGHASAILETSRPKQGFLPPRMTTAQRDSIGYIKSITIVGGSYTVAPTLTITGGTGSGAIGVAYVLTGTTIAADVIEPGIGYKPGTAVTVNLTGGTGSGASASAVISGPDSGLVIYNTSVDSLQYYNGATWVNAGSSTGGTPTLTTNQIAVGASNLLSSSSAYTYDGTTVKQENAIGADYLTSTTTLGSGSGGLFAAFAKATPTAGDQLLAKFGGGSQEGGTSATIGSSMRVYSTSAWSTNKQSYISWYTTSTTAEAERMRLFHNGNLAIGLTAATARLMLAASTGTNQNALGFTVSGSVLPPVPQVGGFGPSSNAQLFFDIANGAGNRRQIVMTDSVGNTTNGMIPIGNGSNYTNATLTAGTGITVTNGAGSITLSVPTTFITNSTYTPTLTNTTNVSASTAHVTGYRRIANSVEVWGEVEIDPVAGAILTELTISLPIASTLSNSFDLAGTAANDGAIGNTARIHSNGSGAAVLSFIPNVITNATYSFHFSYTIN